ncbi:MAG: flavodoxin family protein [Methanobacteriaceae archaeon]
MNVTGFIGSPNENGTTDFLVSKILEISEKNGHNTSKYNLNSLNIGSCQACRFCAENNYCKIEDDMKKMYDQLDTADVIIVGSPIYYGQVTAQTKLFTDRFYCVFNSNKSFKGKKAILVYTQGNSDTSAYEEYTNHDTRYLYEFMDLEVIGKLIAGGLHGIEELTGDKISKEKKEIIKEAEKLGNII